MNRKRELILFFVLAHGFSWLVLVPLVIFHGPLQWVILATFGPTFAALVTNRIVAGELPGISCLYIMGADHGRHCPWSRPHRICLRCASRSNDSRPSKAEVEHFNLLTVYNYSTLLGGPLGEEPGWRGYALPPLEQEFGRLRGIVLLAILWTAWHLPMFLYKGWTSSPLWIYALILTGVSIILSLCAILPASVSYPQ